MCDAGTIVPAHGGGLFVMLTVSYEKAFVNFNDFIVATIQQHWLPIQSTILSRTSGHKKQATMTNRH